LHYRIDLPLSTEIIARLKAGDNVLLTGELYVARDQAHKRIVASLEKGEPLPFDLKGQTIYYMGPSPARPGKVSGSAGPTTSGRMDAYTVPLLRHGLKGMIGKGHRSKEVRESIVKYKAVYFAALGGVGALIARSIQQSDVIAYPELGAEAIRRLLVVDFPAIVINDIYGGDLYEQGKGCFARDILSG
jgi:fumarate hydratase subunit beta